MKNEDVLDTAETLLAYLICSKLSETSKLIRPNTKNVGEEFDISEVLNFDPITPKLAYTAQLANDDRLFCTDSSLLLNSPQDLLGSKSEIALLCDDRVKWLCYKKLNKRPHNVWVGSSGASLYELHYREIFSNGAETYAKRVVAFSKTGKPVVALVSGSNGWAGNDSMLAITSASIIEDAHRPNALTATVKEDTGIIFPVPLGDHKEIFSLREAPLTPSGRRKAILHWVNKHTRKTEFSETNVKNHWRGVKDITIDGLNIKLEGQK